MEVDAHDDLALQLNILPRHCVTAIDDGCVKATLACEGEQLLDFLAPKRHVQEARFEATSTPLRNG
jgi:hypothetical protein